MSGSAGESEEHSLKGVRGERGTNVVRRRARKKKE